MPDYPSVKPRSRAAWRAWLVKHHATAAGVWLRFAKKRSGMTSVSYTDAVEEALCFGWIDGLARPLDETFYLQLFTPRKPRSLWAQSNKTRAARLIADGLMTPSGLAAIETAKANGSWDALSAAEALTLPSDLKKALNAAPRARRHWPQFTESQRKQFLFYLATAKRPVTRARRISEIVSWAARKVTPGQAYEARRRLKGGKT